MKIYIILILLLFTILATGCTDSDATYETLRKAGFHDITTGDYDLFACSDDDFTATTFTAKNVNNDTVTGTVCCGIFKKCTIRY
jgi:hypothetical protein